MLHTIAWGVGLESRARKPAVQVACVPTCSGLLVVPFRRVRLLVLCRQNPHSEDARGSSLPADEVGHRRPPSLSAFLHEKNCKPLTLMPTNLYSLNSSKPQLLFLKDKLADLAMAAAVPIPQPDFTPARGGGVGARAGCRIIRADLFVDRGCEGVHVWLSGLDSRLERIDCHVHMRFIYVHLQLRLTFRLLKRSVVDQILSLDRV